MSKYFLTILLVHSLFGLSRVEAVAVQVILDNGDTLSGQFLAKSEAAISLKVDYLGEISLPLDRVKEIVHEEAAQVVTEEPAPEALEAAAPKQVEAAKSSTASKAEAEELASAEAEASRERLRFGWVQRFLVSLGEYEERLNILPNWDKRLQFGLDSTKGRRDQSSQNYRLEMDRKFESSRITLKSEYVFGQANGATTRDRLSSSYRWRKDFAPGVFYESQSEYFSDQIKLIDSNIEQKLGLGTRLLDQKHSVLSAGLGASGRWREIASRDSDVVYLVSVFQDWDYRMSERIRVKQDFSFAMPLEESDDYELNFSAALTSAVTNSINLSFRYELGFDNSLSADRREDRRFVSSLGYKF